MSKFKAGDKVCVRKGWGKSGASPAWDLVDGSIHKVVSANSRGVKLSHDPTKTYNIERFDLVEEPMSDKDFVETRVIENLKPGDYDGVVINASKGVHVNVQRDPFKMKRAAEKLLAISEFLISQEEKL